MYTNEEEISESHVINACTKGRLNTVVEYLESHKVDEFLSTGSTLLLYAASEAQLEIMEYLTTNGADVNRHKEGYTPLMALCRCSKGTTERRMKCLTLLIESGADVNASNKTRQTALMSACASQEPEFLIELLKHVKDVNACDNMKQTALMYATIANRPEIVKVLIEHAADVTLTDYNDLTASDIAAFKEYTEISSLLNCTEEEIMDTYEIAQVRTWRDLFPSLMTINERTVDSDVYAMLHGMNLDSYMCNFRGMSLKTFLQLTNTDLSTLGVDVNPHRVQFVKQLHKFHRKNWSVKSLGTVNKSLPYTLYNSIISLGIIAKQLAVIGCSFSYIRNSVLESNNTNLIKSKVLGFEEEIKRAQKSLSTLETELARIKELFNKARKGNEIHVPTYIEPKKPKVNWPAFLSITLIIGICVSNANNIKKLIRY